MATSARCALIAVALAGCIESGPGPQPKKIDPAYVTSHLVTAVPTDITRVDADLDGSIIYLGNKVDHDQATPGGPLKITHYWQVKRAPGPGWRVFALLRGGPDTADFMNLEATDMELGHGPDTWKPGEIIEDVQDLTLRPDWRSSTATLFVGLIRIGEHGPLDRMPVRTANEDRAIVARTLTVDLTHAPPPAGTIYVQRARGPITIDGMGTDPGWGGVPSSPEFATAEGASDPVGKATAKMTWDDTYLYVFAQVVDSDIFSPYKNHDESLWKADDVEIFIDADGNRRGYVELQVNPNNATFDSWFATTRAQPGDPTWDSGMVTAVKVRGTPDKEGDTDQGWDAEIAIPWQAVKGRDANMAVRLPPQVGDRWRLNVVRVDKKTGEKEPSASSWNRISSADYHALDRMLTAVFADETGSIVPKPAADSGSGSGSATAAGSGPGSGIRTPIPESGSGIRSPDPESGIRNPSPGSGSGSGSGSSTLAPRPSPPSPQPAAGSSSR